jgi:hypothetical protein
MEIWLGRRRERTGQAAVILRDIFSKLLGLSRITGVCNVVEYVVIPSEEGAVVRY